MSKLALHGGPRTKVTPFGTGQRFGEEELAELREALEQNTLFYWYGKKVKQLCAEFAAFYNLPHCVATSSGTAAIHVALASLGVGVGDEVITSPITDWGTVIGILYQGSVPIFADVDPHTYNLDPGSVEARITQKTRIILVVHLAGNPCDMDGIMALARKYGLRVVEDCAQSYLCRYKDQLAGTFGDFGCFS
ncbi:MAG: aminotransferase class V-fold PLP-dependent enzyme, partial [Bacillota bacterium]